MDGGKNERRRLASSEKGNNRALRRKSDRLPSLNRNFFSAWDHPQSMEKGAMPVSVADGKPEPLAELE